MAPRYELAVGLNRGHKTTKIRVAKNKNEKKKTVCVLPARLKGVSIHSIYSCLLFFFTFFLLIKIFLIENFIERCKNSKK